MKTLIASVMGCIALTGCVAVPVESGPVVYAAPAPAIVVAPRPYYYGYRPHYGYRGYAPHYGGRWR